MASEAPMCNRQAKQTLVSHSSLEGGISRRNSHHYGMGRTGMCWTTGDLSPLPAWQQHEVLGK